jgi:hypothetical protein
MRSLIISYTLENTKPNQRIIIHRLLYGYNDHSNNMTYNYKRRGLIDFYSGRKLNRGVFIIPFKHKDKFIPLLKKNKAKFEVISVNLP